MKKFLAFSMVALLLTATTPYTVNASNLVDSVGATEQDPYGGEDVSQGKTTIYDTQDVTNTEYASTSEITVYATKASKITYKIPQTVIGSSEGSAVYKVGVKGDISSTQTVSITAPASFTLSDGERDVTASITQDKTTWIYSDLTADDLVDGFSMATGIISYIIPAGSFSGTFNFNISVTNN